MQEIPIFPLGTVLFPGMPIHLQIFEMRYLLMLARCLDQELPFGVSLIRKGQEAHGPLAEPFEVGTMVKILETEKLSGGRMRVLCQGEERFRITALDRSGEYLTAQVEKLDFELEEGGGLEGAERKLRPLIERYLKVLAEAEVVTLPPEQVPEEPDKLVYWAMTLLHVAAIQKQPVLESRRLSEMMAEAARLYQREVTLVKATINAPELGEGPEGRVN